MPNKNTPRFWNIASIGEDSAEITLYGEIVTRRPYNWIIDAPDDGLWITPQEFLQELEAVKTKTTLVIRINSVGGDLYTSLGIFTQLKDLPAHKTVIIDGIAASAASVIAMAGDVIQIPPGGSIMIHEAAMTLEGTYQHTDLKLVEKRLEAANDMAAQTYHAKTGLEVDAIRALMAKETWLTGQDAVDKKFADELIHSASAPTMNLSADKKSITVNGVTFSTAGIKALPENIPTAAPKQVPPPKDNDTQPPKGDTKNNEGGTKPLKTLDELKQNNPELYAEAIKEAQNTERERIKAIDAIAGAVGDAELLASAKFGDTPMTAEQLALAAMKKQAAQGAEFQQKTAEDYAKSGADRVKPQNSGNGTDKPLSPVELIAAGREAGKKLNGGKE
jgi:ATP-dependent protease ClpP protease subunit